MLLAAALALHVDLAGETTLRLASAGTGERSVEWTLGTHALGTTDDATAAFTRLPRGDHVLWASSDAEGPWRAMARADAPGDGQASFVPAWTASHRPSAATGPPVLPGMLVLAALACLLGRRRSLLEAGDRPARA